MNGWPKDPESALRELTVEHQHRYVEPTPVSERGGTIVTQAILDEARGLLQNKEFVEEVSAEREKIQHNSALPATRQQRRALQRKVATALRKAAKRDRALRDKLKLFTLEELKQLEAEVARLTSERH